MEGLVPSSNFAKQPNKLDSLHAEEQPIQGHPHDPDAPDASAINSKREDVHAL